MFAGCYLYFVSVGLFLSLLMLVMQVWQGTVAQIEKHYGLRGLEIKVVFFNVSKDEPVYLCKWSINTIVIRHFKCRWRRWRIKINL